MQPRRIATSSQCNLVAMQPRCNPAQPIAKSDTELAFELVYTAVI